MPKICVYTGLYAHQGQYLHHLKRQEADVRAFASEELLVLDPELDYDSVVGLSTEVRERLKKVRPGSIVSAYIYANLPLILMRVSFIGCGKADGRYDCGIGGATAPARTEAECESFYCMS
jgi:hypothetical protein